MPPIPASTRIARMAAVACAAATLGSCCCGPVDATPERPAECREPATWPAVAALPDSLLVIVQSPQLDTAQERRLNVARAQPTAARVEVARLSPAAFRMLQPGNPLVLSVSATRSFAVTGQQYTEGLGSRSYTGRINGANGEVTLVHTAQGVTGTVQSMPGDATVPTVYSIHPIGGDLHAVICVDPTRFPPD